jgi:hypothetical protein
VLSLVGGLATANSGTGGAANLAAGAGSGVAARRPAAHLQPVGLHEPLVVGHGAPGGQVVGLADAVQQRLIHLSRRATRALRAQA